MEVRGIYHDNVGTTLKVWFHAFSAVNQRANQKSC